ncbi:MAG: xanthine dehydrogenase family protein subunit M [Deltaproteobacteria bacterium]|nr:xanthine dehydrogenase family protein subunit M [Deltaproteobacteria bacterium]
MRFEYVEPRTVGEAVSFLSAYDGKAKIIAGGTDLINLIQSKSIRPDYVVDIACIPGLDYVKYDGKGDLFIGVLTTIRTLEVSAEVKKRHPVIAQAARRLGSVAIRNVGTIGGNLCHASPAAETAPSLIALGARVKIVGPMEERTLALEDFFIGPGQTVLRRGEMMVEIQVPAMQPHTKGVYLKHSIRGPADLAIVGVAAVATCDPERCEEVRIALGAVAPTPIRARNAEEALEGKQIDGRLIETAARAASDQSRPITDLRASAGYRKEMVKVFTRSAIREIFG